MCVYISVCAYICMCVYQCVHMHVYIHMHVSYVCTCHMSYVCICHMSYVCICHMFVYVICMYDMYIHMHMYAHICTSSWGDISGLTYTLAILVRLHQHNSVSTDTNLSHFIEFTLATSLLEWTTMKHLSIMNLVSNYLTQFLHPAKCLLTDRLYHLKKNPSTGYDKKNKRRLWIFRHDVSLVPVNPFSLLGK